MLALDCYEWMDTQSGDLGCDPGPDFYGFRFYLSAVVQAEVGTAGGLPQTRGQEVQRSSTGFAVTRLTGFPALDEIQPSPAPPQT